MLITLDFMTKDTMINNESYYVMRRGSISEKNIKILKIICLAAYPQNE